MKYKEGDLVRIKSKTWWDKQPKNEEGDATFNFKYLVYFSREMIGCCGRMGEIIKEPTNLPYLIEFGNKCW